MRLELAIRPELPVSRELCDREVSSRLRDVEKHGPDLEGNVGNSARCRSKPYFPYGSTGEIDRTLVKSLDLALEFRDARDVEPLIEWCYGIAGALNSPLCAHEGAPLDRESATEMLRELVRERERQRIGGFIGALIGTAIMTAGGLCICGIDLPDFFGVDEATGVRHHIHFVGIGVGLITAGVAVVGGAMTAMKD